MVRAVMKKLVFFYYNDGSRSQGTVGTLLKTFTGYLQSDGWQAYNVFDKEDQVCLVSCMAHIRRYYEKSLNENKALAEHAERDPAALPDREDGG
jgi:IS1 family transposase